MPKRGEIHKRIACTGVPSRSYALYIPPGNTSPARPGTGNGEGTPRLYPVMIAFDPHGDGLLPLTIYRDLADRYGFILFGSNDSKNGLGREETEEIVSVMMHDVRTVYPVDTNRFYLLGFSGGARVAAMAAMHKVPVKGVIGCGAGFGSSDKPILNKFDFFGIAGTADFNMDELQQLDGPLSRAGFRHFITTFAGSHAWPPASVMEDGFRWITLNAMKDGIVKKDTQYVSEVIAAFVDRATTAIHRNELIAAADAYRAALSFTEGLVSADQCRKDLLELEKLPAYQARLAYRKKVLELEVTEKEELMQALQSEGPGWWKRKITTYHNHKADPEDTLKDRRVLSFISLYCYMNANAAMAQQDDRTAGRIIEIYETVDPGNPEPNYMRAVLLARGRDEKAAFGQLKIAVIKGFSDKPRLAAQPEFRSMNGSPEWSDLIKSQK